MPPPRATAIRLRLRNTLLAQRNGQRKKPHHPSQQRQQWQKMWVSTNKVLIGSVGGLKKTHFRNPNFECDETKLLISLWGDPKVQRTLITTHKKHPVIAKLAEKMREYGYNRSTEEINTRIKNLKCFYNRIKKDLEQGTINEPSWKHYKAMDEILTRPVFGGANAAGARKSDEPSTSGGLVTRRSRRHSAGSAGPGDLSEDPDDQIEVKLELVSDDDKDLRPEELLKNAEQVELKEPNLLIPKDEPMEEDADDPNDPDFEHDGGSETDDESSGMDEADESDRSTRLRRRTKRVHKPSKTHPATGGPSTSGNVSKNQPTVITSVATSTAPPVSRAIKIMNYPAGSYLKFTSVASVGSGVSSATNTTGITTLAGGSSAVTTTPSSKISLVPTNFLLKPQASNLGFKQPIQLYTKPTVSIASTTKPTTSLQPVVTVSSASTVSTTGSSTGTPAAPMKLLLVNTLPKDGSAPKQQLINPQTKQIYTTSTGVPLQKVTGLPGSLSIQPRQLVPKPVTGATPIEKLLPTIRPAPSAGGPPKLGGFKALLGQLVGLQRENLGISKTRLLTEKERFGNEKSVANSLMDALGELNALLMEASAELNQSAEEKASEMMHIKISNARHVPSLHALVDQPKEISSRPALQPVIDDESVKTEVISDSEEG
ncbi:hypothetical protein ZHAS_00022343 [Anopheles sinensis]|uniref:Myb/SANT-like DNA-binding domain-containing protein n=1 Tax=Anopheles sinensis TaxID=74873 RepID=A0A084WUK3_ANOSI|nr:hypothetical protein ZHAS_00022343 [Anopheles sinensis]